MIFFGNQYFLWLTQDQHAHITLLKYMYRHSPLVINSIFFCFFFSSQYNKTVKITIVPFFNYLFCSCLSIWTCVFPWKYHYELFIHYFSWISFGKFRIHENTVQVQNSLLLSLSSSFQQFYFQQSFNLYFLLQKLIHFQFCYHFLNQLGLHYNEDLDYSYCFLLVSNQVDFYLILRFRYYQ